MTWLLYVLAALVVLDAFRLRGRAVALTVLPPSDEPIDPAHRFLTGPGVTLDEATRRAASAHARREGLTVLDVWPADLSPEFSLGLLSLLDVPKFRRMRLARGFTAGQAMLVDVDVLERAQLPVPGPAPDDPAAHTEDPVAFLNRAVTLKRFACTGFDFAVAPGLRAAPEDPDKRLALARAAMGGMTGALFAARVAWLVLIFGGAVWHPQAAGALLGVWMTRPVLVLAGTALQSGRLFVYSALRPLFEVYGLVRTALGRWRPPDPHGGVDPVTAARPVYAELMRDGLDPFFQPRREDCPICGGRSLKLHFEVGDLFQFKPGRFRLERCGDCGHIFQNPQLSVRGLGFYYRDFYDGLDAEALESLLGAGPQVYEARAKMVQGHGEPSTWLDVGGGSGHLCCVSRDTWPKTRFDGLDLSAGIEEAARRGWVDRAIRGLFPETAPSLAGQYDVVSMSHYLEHTLDPKAEVAAAALALRPGGLFLVEVPDPACFWGRALGRYWLPWFQPQHLHLLSVENLERLLRAHGFEPLVWHRGETHHPLDLFLATSLFLNRVLPKPDRPWLPPAGLSRRLGHKLGWTFGMGLLLVMLILDALLAPVMRRPGGANTFRVLARRGP